MLQRFFRFMRLVKEMKVLKKSLDGLDPKFRVMVEEFLKVLDQDKKLLNMGVARFLIVEAKRSMETQLVYFMRSRMMDPADTQMAYKRVLGWVPSLEDCRKPVTWTLESKHLIGLAIDICPSKDGSTHWWRAPEEVWLRMGELAKQCGLKWGGDWKDHKDTPHFEK